MYDVCKSTISNLVMAKALMKPKKPSVTRLSLVAVAQEQVNALKGSCSKKVDLLKTQVVNGTATETSDGTLRTEANPVVAVVAVVEDP